jgi:hypothetical protein
MVANLSAQKFLLELDGKPANLVMALMKPFMKGPVSVL